MIRAVVLSLAVVLQTAVQGLVVPTFAAPSRTATPPTADQLAEIRAGAALYDQGRYDEAQLKFEAVLAASPDCAMAMHELVLTHFARKNYQKAIDVAAKGTMYNAQPGVLAQFYVLIGNALDDGHEPSKAVAAYRQGIEFAPGAPLYYNLAVTYAQSLTDVPSAKAALKSGAQLDPAHASTQLLLSRLFLMEDLKTPALLALSRFLILEPATPRTGDAYQIWYRLLNGNVSVSGNGGVNITINKDQPSTEGNLMKLDLFLSLSKATSAAGPEPRTPVQQMVEQFSRLFAMYGSTDPEADKGTFLWTYYMPFFVEMQKKDFVEPFVYYVSQRTDLVGVREWLTVNRERVLAFLAWARGYSFPALK